MKKKGVFLKKRGDLFSGKELKYVCRVRTGGGYSWGGKRDENRTRMSVCAINRYNPAIPAQGGGK